MINIQQTQKTYKGEYYIKILDSIDRIRNYMQIEPHRTMIDLFAKKTGDVQLKQELIQHLLEKSKNYQDINFQHS